MRAVIPRNSPFFQTRPTPVSLSTASAFYGVIYAPYADLEINNHEALYGAVLAGAVEMKNAGNFYFDRSLKDKYLTQDVVMSSWVDVRR